MHDYVNDYWLWTVFFLLVDEKGLTVQMKALMKEKNDAISKMAELQKWVSYSDNVIKYV